MVIGKKVVKLFMEGIFLEELKNYELAITTLNEFI